jgi:hypothetical protein
MIYFKRKVLFPERRGTKVEWDKLFADYRKHLNAIRAELSDEAWGLARLSFHDAKAKAVAVPDKRKVLIKIYGTVCDLLEKSRSKPQLITLSFSGVKKARVPDAIVGDFWLYEEMHLSEIAAFDYQVLLHKDEIRVQADRVELLFEG